MPRYLAPCLLALLLSLPGFPVSWAAEERAAQASRPVLTIYNWDEYMAPDLLRRFEAKHGVRIDYLVYGSTEELMRNVAAHPGRYDVIIPSSYSVAQLRGKGMLAPLDKTRLPNLRNLDPLFMSPNFDPGSRYCVAYLWSKLVLGYNAKNVRHPPKHWKDIFDPRHAGRIALLSDNRETLGVVLLGMGFSPNTTDPAEIAKARDFLIAHNTRVRSYADDSGDALLEAGTVDIALEWEGDIARLAEQRPAFRYTIPVEGSVFATDSMCIPKTSRNKALAEQFIDFMLDADVGATLATYLRYPTPNLAAQARMSAEDRVRFGLSKDMRDRLFFLSDLGTTTQALYEAAWGQIRQHHNRSRPQRR